MSLYSDLNRRSPRVAPTVIDLEAVFQAVENLLRTPPRQRLFHPEGVDIESLIFELDVDVEFRVKNEIFAAIQRDERVIMQYGLSSVVRYPDENLFKVTVVFKVVGLGDKIFARSGNLFYDGTM